MKKFKATPKIAIGPGDGKVAWFDGEVWVTTDHRGGDENHHSSIYEVVYCAWEGDLDADEANQIVDVVLDAIDLFKPSIPFRLREKYSDCRTQSQVEFYLNHIQPILRPAQKET